MEALVRNPPDSAPPLMEESRFGTWPSPLPADSVAGQAIRLGMVRLTADGVIWSESRPYEGGRSVICYKPFGGPVSDLIPAPFSARCRINGYGGGEFLPGGGGVIFTHEADQALYSVTPGETPRRIVGRTGLRLGDGCLGESGGRLFCVAEQDEANGWPKALLMTVSLADGHLREIGRGRDFYTTLRVSPDGERLAWITWDLPHMPWEAAELWVADIGREGALVHPRRIAGGNGSAVFQPEWRADGSLVFVWDKTGWGNLYCWRDGEPCRPLYPAQAEYGQPQWVLGMRSFAILEGERLAVSPFRNGAGSLAVLDPATASEDYIETPFQSFSSVTAARGRIACIAGGPVLAPCVVLVDVATRSYDIIHAPGIHAPGKGSTPPEIFQKPHFITFPTAGGAEAYGLYYGPHNPAVTPPRDKRPPLIVSCHGGPTAMADRALSLKIQFWTSQGFAWLDVDYRGSFGYGRSYREALNGHWGVADAEDAIYGARFLAKRGMVEPSELFITGSSAGGFTALAALAACDLFRAGAIYYGIGDLERLQALTHKFESGYVAGLAGIPWREGKITAAGKDVLRARSPIHHAGKISAPVIFFQGCDDVVVPPQQSRDMADKLRERGVPVACMMFEGEGHGFRGAEAIRRALTGHYAFYARVLGFNGPAMSPPLDILNEEAL